MRAYILRWTTCEEEAVEEDAVEERSSICVTMLCGDSRDDNIGCGSAKHVFVMMTMMISVVMSNLRSHDDGHHCYHGQQM